MARFRLFRFTNIDGFKKVLVVLVLLMMIGFILKGGMSFKFNVSNVHKSLQGYFRSGQSKNQIDSTGTDLNRIPNRNHVIATNASEHIINLNYDITTRRQNRSYGEKGDTLKGARAESDRPVKNKVEQPLSAEDFYKDPRNIMPTLVDPIKASNVSWLTYLSASEKESVFKEYAKMGIESTELHSFKSFYIIDPRIYRTPDINNVTSKKVVKTSQVKKKIISCYACENWMVDNWTIMFNRDFKKCPYCQFDLEGKMVPEAEAVIFFPRILGERPVPKRPMGQIWIMAEWESPVHFHYPKSYEKWKSVFNWTFTYTVDSDIFAPYYRFAWRNRDLLLSDEEYLSIAKQKTKTAAWFVSNCVTQSKREEYVKKLQEYIDVDIYGKCGTKKCEYKIHKDCEKLLTSTYKFYLSFENSFCKDYVTEKLFRSYELRTHLIPVTRGGFEYHKYIPPGGYVDAADFKSPKELGLFLKELGNDVKRYAEMLKEKDRLLSLGYKVDWCNICEKLHTRSPFENKIIPDVKHRSHHGACYPPPGWRKVF